MIGIGELLGVSTKIDSTVEVGSGVEVGGIGEGMTLDGIGEGVMGSEIAAGVGVDVQALARAVRNINVRKVCPIDVFITLSPFDLSYK